MKYQIIIIISIFIAASGKSQDFDYLGIAYPKGELELFADEIISVEGRNENPIAISPLGNEIFFSTGIWPECKIMHIRKSGNKWSKANIASFSMDCYSTEPAFSPDGRYLYFSSSKGRKDIKDYCIWRMEKNDTGWGDPEIIIDIEESQIMEFHPSITNNYDVYFCRWDDSIDKGRIFKSKHIEGEYGKPEKVSIPFESCDSDTDPYVDPDEKILITSSRGDNSIGGYDLYISFADKSMVWKTPANIGTLLNTIEDEYSIDVSPDGKYAFVYKNNDVYWVDIKTLLEKHTSKCFKESMEKSKMYVNNFMKENMIPGMQIAVSHKGELIWSQGFGYANVEFEIGVNEITKFRIASVSKPITAVLTAYLYQNGVVDIDEPISNILIEFNDLKYEFTIRQLMSHAAGIRHYLMKDTAFNQYHNTIQNGLKIINNDSLLFEPGSRFSYSSYGYNIIGAYLEKSTTILFQDLLSDSLFIPLGTVNSTIDHPYNIIQYRSSGYQLDIEGNVINAKFYDNRYKIPSGGILSTAEDLVKFGNELLYGDYLNEKSKDLLFTPFEFTDQEDSDTGFGWVTTKDKNGHILYGHLGGNTGGCSAIMIYPEKDFVIVWLGNRDAGWSEVPITTIADFFIDRLED